MMPSNRGLLIGGREVDASSQSTTRDLSPYDGTLVATVAGATTSDVTRAIDAAARSFGDWSHALPQDRRRVLLTAADALESRRLDIVATMAAETGATSAWAHFNVSLSAEMLRYAAAVTTASIGDVLPSDLPGCMSMTIREPVGVVASLTPWNAPLILCTRAIAVPLALGNTVVLKPSESAPLSAGLVLADVLQQAGLPDGVINVITNDPIDAAHITETLIADSRVRRVNFTGSTKVGRIIAQIAARHLTPALLELGGKNSLLVLQGADVDYAVSAVAFAAYMNSGQICMSADRVLVHESLAAEFTEKLAARAGTLICGDPAEPKTHIGPLIDPAAATRITAMVEDAASQGARILTGRPAPTGPAGTLLAPVVVTDIKPDMRLYGDEVFGPVCTVTPFVSNDEAITIANDSPYGLTAGVLTEDLGAGLDVARRLRTGIVHINDQTVGDEPQAPFGGVKDSGYGRFNGDAGIAEFTDLRWITIQQTHRQFPL